MIHWKYLTVVKILQQMCLLAVNPSTKKKEERQGEPALTFK